MRISIKTDKHNPSAYKDRAVLIDVEDDTN